MAKIIFATDRWTRFLLVPALVFIATIADRNYQTDLWHHLARGRAIVTEGRLLDEDRFTYTVHDQPLQDVNWGWQVLFYRLYTVGELPLVQTVNSAILSVLMVVLVVLAWRRSGSLIAACAAGIVAFLDCGSCSSFAHKRYPCCCLSFFTAFWRKRNAAAGCCSCRPCSWRFGSMCMAAFPSVWC